MALWPSATHCAAEGTGEGDPPGRSGSAKESTSALPATLAGTPGKVFGASSYSAQASNAPRDWVAKLVSKSSVVKAMA